MDRRTFIFASLFGISAVAPPLAFAKKGGRDNDDADDAVRSGKAMPIAAILKKISPKLGEILEIELENDHGRLVYEIKYLDQGGRRREAYVDAASGRFISTGDD